MIDGKKIIVSLDGMTLDAALSVAKRVSGRVWGFKVNDLIYEDVHVISELQRQGRVFVDVKLHDIPNTVANSVRRLSTLGADIITVHSMGGVEMMQRARDAARKETMIIAVTILTSEQADSNTLNAVRSLVELAVTAHADGVVCTGPDIEEVRRVAGMEERQIIVPGIRPEWYGTHDDQKRVIAPKFAVEAGADLIVIGRPITGHEDPLAALQAILTDTPIT